MASTTTTTSLRGALFLAALFHASTSWDASNIWFPDTNNPVFYNMTFYQQAAQNLDNTAENLITITEQPPQQFQADRKRPRPAVFNQLPETRPPVPPTETQPSNRNRFTTTTPRPREKKPTRNRQPSTTAANGRLQGRDPQSDIGRLIAEQEMFLRNEQNQQFFGNPSRDANTPRPQSGVHRLAAEQREFIRNEQDGQRFSSSGVTASSPQQSGNRRHSTDRHKMFVRNEQRADFYPEISVGYKTVPLEDTTAAGTQTYYNDGSRQQQQQQQQLSGNRLRRTKNGDIADGGDYFNRGGGNNGGRLFSDEQRWNGNRDDAILNQARSDAVRRVETTSNGIANERSFARPVQRAVDSAEETRRRWNNYAGTTGDGGTYRVEDNVITGREETASKQSGPSKCVWAIISCCKPSSPQIRYTCFETLGCHGAFWDTNPCSKEMTMAAVQATADFYNIPRSVD